MSSANSKKHIFSSWQKAIFYDIANGTGNTLVIARAGCAKTSSLVEGARYLPRGKSALFCAFNKVIQEELKDRLPNYVSAQTCHSIGFHALRLRFPNITLDQDKAKKIVEGLVGKDADLNYNICKAVSLCKAILQDTPDQIDGLMIDYDIDTCNLDRDKFIHIVCQVLRKCKEDTATIDFDDMVWMCFVYGISPAKYDYVFVDEAQDLNKSMIELALASVKPNGRIIAVLDNFQAIYGFRGADSQVLENLRKRLSPKELSLPVCYRCPKKIVYLAQKAVPDIKSYENNIDGEIIHINNKDLEKYATPGCFVLSRTNAPLIANCMQFIKHGIKANIRGRDIGNNLSWMIKKSGKKTINGFLTWLDKWAEQETKMLAKKGKKNTYVTDKVECLQIICENVKSIEEAQQKIKDMFDDADDDRVVCFSSIHKAKGDERDVVLVLHDTLRKDSQEEINIGYVAFTRSKQKLYLASANNNLKF